MSQNAIDWVQRSYARRGRSGDGRCHVLAVDTNAVYWGGTYPGRNPPNWRLVQNLCTSPVDILLDNEDGEAFRDDAASRCGNGPGFLSNRDIAYVFAPTSRGFGDVLVLRGRAPTFADTRRPGGHAERPAASLLIVLPVRAGDPAGDRLPLRRPCERRRGRALHDRGLRAGGPARERAARVRRHVARMGPADPALLIYRHMLPDPSIAQAIQNVPEPGAELAVMGDYHPRGEYLPDPGDSGEGLPSRLSRTS